MAKPKVRLYIDLGYACFQEKYYRVCIARAAVSVCEDSHAEFAMVIYKTDGIGTHTMCYLELMVA